MEEARGRGHGGHEAEVDGAHHAADDVYGEAALGLRGVRAEHVLHQRQVGLPVDGVGGPDGLPLKAQHQGQGHGQEDGAEVAELLEQQGGPGGDHDGDVGPGVDAKLGHKRENRHAHQAGGGLDLLVVQDFQHVGAGEDAQEQGVENGENDEGTLPDGNLDLSDGVRDEDEDEGQQIQNPFRPDPLPQGGVCAFDFFHGAHSFIVDDITITHPGFVGKGHMGTFPKNKADRTNFFVRSACSFHGKRCQPAA